MIYQAVRVHEYTLAEMQEVLELAPLHYQRYCQARRGGENIKNKDATPLIWFSRILVRWVFFTSLCTEQRFNRSSAAHRIFSSFKRWTIFFTNLFPLINISSASSLDITNVCS